MSTKEKDKKGLAKKVKKYRYLVILPLCLVFGISIFMTLSNPEKDYWLWINFFFLLFMLPLILKSYHAHKAMKEQGND